MSIEYHLDPRFAAEQAARRPDTVLFHVKRASDWETMPEILNIRHQRRVALASAPITALTPGIRNNTARFVLPSKL